MLNGRYKSRNESTLAECKIYCGENSLIKIENV